MKRLTILLILLAIAPATIWAKDSKDDEGMILTATLVGVRGSFAAHSIPITFYINRLTTENEVAELSTLLREKGVHALRLRMEKLELGKVNPAGHIGADIATARVHQLENGQRLINITTTRNMPFFELYVSGRTVDYPFSFFQILLDENGKGTGTAIVAARPRFKEDGTLEVESYGITPTFILQGVKLSKRKPN